MTTLSQRSSKSYSAEELRKLTRFRFEDNDVRALVVEALSRIPTDVADKVLGECIFLMPRAREPAWVIPRQFTDDLAIIWLSEVLLEKPREEALFAVLHEIAHVVLDHNEVLDFRDSTGQEQQANDQARAWLASEGSVR